MFTSRNTSTHLHTSQDTTKLRPLIRISPDTLRREPFMLMKTARVNTHAPQALPRVPPIYTNEAKNKSRRSIEAPPWLHSPGSGPPLKDRDETQVARTHDPPMLNGPNRDER
ncbi:hypothetical protein F2Q69_00054149 [Brassica cretica]|uniref:Uncharacterized protein n=1 Tax=Brassica cretica TaxID=69181 RepID=A0A8S9MSY4_BRACR|nr:hypothetical protein F2Q69_00054149 [Brassica cretica]